ncbi:MAG: ribosome silencing factor [Ignavibacteria bacterium GWA2_55_11]|nr:MAG: ribosome silencing factor [Ignavibacteria bacterium GWA2_55_11]OGU46828.1 MAG: ribosome silencing factor [Ignavibacteria bacterium GWC2_56_12]OGU69764.1 MAG: ribosome silencing factor [Ignavibacteria bacterium RIFCSPLOWO2_02_FULL_55_14]OGU75914.1 MAG: ribosome silencing factor [Ignavibacteria bacterium RIFCSPLOWO2_12_FULL_56_21]
MCVTSRTLAKLVASSMIAKKAHDVLLMDLRKVTSTADFFVVCSADSDMQVRAIADAIEDATADADAPVWHSEGRQALMWVILDYVDVVAHVFHKETRKFYNLERLWSDAKMTHIRDEDGKAPVRRRPAAKKRSVRK